jgi:hypothetical protein
VIIKAPSLNPLSVATATAQRLYLRETSFYRELAPDLTIATPECFFVGVDDDASFLLVLEDMAPSSPVDQFGGLSLEHTRAGLGELARLHAPTRNDHALHAREWLAGTKQALAPLYASILPDLYQTFLERYADHAPVDVLETVRSFAARLHYFSNFRSPYECVVHGDFRTDNLLFEARGGTTPLAVVDWQTVSTGSPMLDVAYFLATSLTDDDVVTSIDELLAFYGDACAQLGAPLDARVVRKEFARYLLQPVSMLAPAAVLVERTERGDRMFLEMLQRASALCAHFGSIEELDRHAAT